MLAACADGRLDAEVGVVVANRREAYGLVRAEQAGIATVCLERRPGEPRSDYDVRLAAVVSEHRPDLVVLAGWMRILTTTFVESFPVINLHPALPGTFPGANAIEEAFAAFAAGSIDRSGVMIHWVPDAGVDSGPVIVSAEVPFEPDDTLDSFAARVHSTEHRAIVDGIARALRDLDHRKLESP